MEGAAHRGKIIKRRQSVGVQLSLSGIVSDENLNPSNSMDLCGNSVKGCPGFKDTLLM